MIMTGYRRKIWEASHYFDVKDCTEAFGVVLLNESLQHQNLPLFSQLWNAASFRVCIDGAINLYHELLWTPHHKSLQPNAVSQELHSGSPIHQVNGSSCNVTHVALPDFISGDFDSADRKLLDFYHGLGVPIIHTPDQNETDFTKGLKEMKKFFDQKAVRVPHVLVVVSGTNNRFDHTIANLNTLYKVLDIFPAEVILLNQWSATWLLSAKTEHIINIPSNLRTMPRPDEAWCGLIPLGHPASVTTKGLKWNLSGEEIAFGELVSTSNTYDLTGNGQVQIWTSHPILWTMGFISDNLTSCENGIVW